MKVLHLCSERGWRGGEQQVVYLVEELALQGIQVVLAIKKGSALERYCIESNKKFYTVPYTTAIDPYSAYRVMQICKNEGIDIIHMHSSKAHGVGVLSSYFGNVIPLVLSRRVEFVPKSNWITKWKYTHRSIKRIIGVSKRISQIMSTYTEKHQKCVTIYDGIDLKKFDNVLNENEILRAQYNVGSAFLIGNIGALSPSKDHYTFIDTIEILHEHELSVHAIIIGDGSLRSQLEQYVSMKGLSNVITFTGFQKQIGKLLLALDLFLMTSKEEGLGTSLLDAFLAKIPVVATAAGGIPEIVINNKTGLLSPVGDPILLANNVKALIENSSLRNELREKAHEFVANFSKEKMAYRTMNIYKEILSIK